MCIRDSHHSVLISEHVTSAISDQWSSMSSILWINHLNAIEGTFLNIWFWYCDMIQTIQIYFGACHYSDVWPLVKHEDILEITNAHVHSKFDCNIHWPSLWLSAIKSVLVVEHVLMLPQQWLTSQCLTTDQAWNARWHFLYFQNLSLIHISEPTRPY